MADAEIMLFSLCADKVRLGDPDRPHVAIVRCQPQRRGVPFAFKPERIIFSDEPVPASSWRLQEVLIGGHEQLGGPIDGEVFRSSSLGGLLASGFRTFGVGPGGLQETMDLVICRRDREGDSTMGSLRMFRGAVLGVEVDPALPAHAFSGQVRLRSKKNGASGLIAATCQGPGRIGIGERGRFVVRPVDEDLVFRPTRLELDAPAADWEIVGLEVDGRSQIAPGVQELPGVMFCPDAFDGFVTFNVMRREIGIEVRYVGAAPGGGRLGVTVRGDVFARAEIWPPLGVTWFQRPGIPLG
jgi:hypothetical protein